MRIGDIAIRALGIAALSVILLSLPRHQTTDASAIPARIASPTPPVTTTSLVAAFADRPLLGADAAKGVVIWSHGRSLTHEDSASATPLYLASFASAGWDVMRFNRPRGIDLLKNSTADLVARVHQLRTEGYKHVVLAGQSYGGFIALGAAQNNADIDDVIATAPAAFGNFFDSYGSWQANGEQLAKLLRGVGHTRVVLAFFHGDDYDPGGRGQLAREILTAQHTPFLLIDQPRDLVGHLAANTGLFVRRFAGCLVAFAAATGGAASTDCDDSWGLEPSIALLNEPRGDIDAALPESAATGASDDTPEQMTGRWYGYYPNGREFLVDITSRQGDHIEAVYGIGPSVDGKTDASWVERKGIMTQGALVFDEAGRSRITLTPTGLGTMDVLWRAPGSDAKNADKLEATARRIH